MTQYTEKVIMDSDSFVLSMVCEIEESFQIDILDGLEKYDKKLFDKKSGMKIAELVAFVLTKLSSRKQTDDCSTLRVFLQMRSWLAEKFQRDKREIRPGMALDDVFPKGRQRRKIWREFEHDLGYTISSLGAPGSVNLVLVLLFFVSIFVIFIWRPDIGCLSLISIFVTIYCWNKYGTAFSLFTIKDLVSDTVKHNYCKTKRVSGTYNRQEVEKIIIDYIADFSGSKVNLETSIVLV